MSKAILISIRPQWCELIASGKKTIEVRKTRPKIDTPFKCYIYETKGKTDVPTFVDEDGHYIYEGRGQIIGEFVCDGIIVDKTLGHDEMFYTAACLTAAEVAAYCTNDEMYGWHISDLVIYDNPKELSEFHRPCTPACNYSEECGGANATDCLFGISRAPQSWCYVEEFF